MRLNYPSKQDMLSIFNKAMDYAKKSQGYTYDYEGFRDESENKVERIITGRIGQEWLYRVLELNDIPFIADRSGPKEADEYDIIIMDRVYDVKTSRRCAFGWVPPQVAYHLKQKNIYGYCFLETTDRDLDKTLIHPVGFVTKDNFWRESNTVNRGEKIPTTPIINKFRKTNILIPNDCNNCLVDFETAIETMIAEMIKNISQNINTNMREVQKITLEKYIGGNSIIAIANRTIQLSEKVGKLVNPLIR